MEKNNEKNSALNAVDFENNEINHNNFPIAICWLIQEVKTLRDLLEKQRAPVVIVNDRIDSIEEACKITGYSKSKLYKLSSTNAIPHKLMGNRLVFSRNELLAWLESNTVARKPKSKSVLTAIAQSASKRERASR